MEKYQEIIDKLEDDELTLPAPNVNLYTNLFAYYLLQYKLIDAKFLWARIPDTIKENRELQILHLLWEQLKCNNYSDFFKHIEYEWSSGIKPIIEELLQITRQKMFNLVGNAYTSIFEQNLMELTNMSKNQLKETCTTLNWLCDDTGDQTIIFPQPLKNTDTIVSTSEYQMSKLTDFVSFLEN